MMRDDKRVDVDAIKRTLSDPREVCRRLGLDRGAKPQGGGLMVPCPAHEERTPSCSITRGADGTLRVHCFGCSFAGDVFSLLAVVENLDVDRDFLERANSEESERVPRVAEQLKMIADEDGVALICLSDTTKESVKSGSGSSAGMRGSYMLNHLATTLLGLHSAKDASTLAARLVDGGLAEKGQKDSLEQLLVDSVPPWFESDAAVSELGRRYAFVDCSGNRNGPDDPMCLGYVRGAMTFVEASGVAM